MSNLLSFAHELADVAGAVVMPYYRSQLAPQDKAVGAAFDPVTIADRAGEEVMRALIRKRFPTHGVIGEEFGKERPDAEHVWVLDPIDGTRAYISGMPTWGILIGLLQEGKPALGVIDQPYLRERFWGDGTIARARGFGDERVLQTRRGKTLDEAMVWVSSTFTTDPARQAVAEVLRPHVRMLRYGSDCLAMAMLAEGHIDIVLETGLELYDIAATVPIVTGARGVISGLDGAPAIQSSSILAAGDPQLHRRVLSMLAEAVRSEA